MTQERINELYTDYSSALKRLGEALRGNVKKGSIAVDGAIQRYEFTFELAWKLLRAVLEYNGIEAATPRSAIKEAYKAKIITDGEDWIDMLEDRNKTSHIYDEAQALAIYKKIKMKHLRSFQGMRNEVKKTTKIQSRRGRKA